MIHGGMSLIIARQEFRRLFATPLAWITLAVVQFVLAYLFLSRIELFLQYQPRLRTIDNAPGMTEIIANGLFTHFALILIVVIALFTAKSFAEEKRNQSLILLLCSPITTTQIVLGKFIGFLTYFFLLIGLSVILVSSLSLAGQTDTGQLLAGFIALILLCSAATSLGLFISSLSQQTTSAAIFTFMCLAFLWIVQWDKSRISFVTYLSLEEHFSSINSGVIASVDVIYFLLFTLLFLGLTRMQLNREPG